MRYVVVKGSETAHCCFEATVVDTEKPVMVDGRHYQGQFEPICECFGFDEANMIAIAMNAAFEKWAVEAKSV